MARFGVLEFVYNAFYPKNAFAGALFIWSGASRHMLVQHYLDPMFDEGNMFLESHYSVDDIHRTHSLAGVDPDAELAETLSELRLKIRDVSRLAAYLHGDKPESSWRI
jgi:hypothetical protein